MTGLFLFLLGVGCFLKYLSLKSDMKRFNNQKKNGKMK